MPNYDRTTSEWQTIPGYHVTCTYFSRNVPFVPVQLRLAVRSRLAARPKNRASSRHREYSRPAGYVSRYGPGTRASARLPPRRVAGADRGIHGVYRADPDRVPCDERREPGYASPGNAPGDDQVPDHVDGQHDRRREPRR